MVVIGGRPGMGKSALATQIAVNAAKSLKARSLVFSLEMSKKQLVRRMISAESGIEENRIKAGRINENEWPVYMAGAQTVSELPITIDDTAILTPQQLRAKAWRHYAKFGLDLLIVDYLQLMAGDGRSQNKHQEISEISRTCKLLARELNIPVVVLSQLSRKCEERGNKRPLLSDLRESGAIEADADIVMFLYRDEVYNEDTEFPGIAEAIIAKHRGGPTGTVDLFFKKNLTQFVDLEIRTVALSVDF
jgi:replicative DNA helicase